MQQRLLAKRVFQHTVDITLYVHAAQCWYRLGLAKRPVFDNLSSIAYSTLNTQFLPCVGYIADP